jgi:VIT1/CCC1 family predicted Fe2+/Mn2+ transporter
VEISDRTWFDRIMSSDRQPALEPPGQHSDEPHRGGLAQRLNWLRAGILGANDGIVSVAAIVVGVAGATTATAPIVTAGIAGLIGGAISMALGEYVSVSSQRDSEHAMIEKEKRELAETPEEELIELAGLYQQKGLRPETARQVAIELTERDALRAHLSTELNIDPDDVVSPWYAALSSAVAFLCGGVLPLLAILLPPEPARVPAVFLAVVVALGVTGGIGALLGESSARKAVVRVIVGGAAALSATFIIGNLLGTSGLI